MEPFRRQKLQPSNQEWPGLDWGSVERIPLSPCVLVGLTEIMVAARGSRCRFTAPCRNDPRQREAKSLPFLCSSYITNGCPAGPVRVLSKCSKSLELTAPAQARVFHSRKMLMACYMVNTASQSRLKASRFEGQAPLLRPVSSPFLYQIAVVAEMRASLTHSSAVRPTPTTIALCQGSSQL